MSVLYRGFSIRPKMLNGPQYGSQNEEWMAEVIFRKGVFYSSQDTGHVYPTEDDAIDVCKKWLDDRFRAGREFRPVYGIGDEVFVIMGNAIFKRFVEEIKIVDKRTMAGNAAAIIYSVYSDDWEAMLDFNESFIFQTANDAAAFLMNNVQE